jgi:hypothetical protein
MFVLDDTKYAAFNLIPLNSSSKMNLNLEYRLINKEERKYMNETLALMGIGFILILGFLIVLFRALNLS